MDYEISEQALEAVVLCAPEGLVVDLLLAVPYGVAIPELAARVQQEVDEALFLATGRRARAVNVTVGQVVPKEDHAQAG